MTDHDRAAHHAEEAERLLDWVGDKKMKGPDVQIAATRADAHATLAVYYATVARSS